MSAPPEPTPIYHITHVKNLESILRDGGIYSDKEMIDRGGPSVGVGMSTIKERRLNLPVRCNPGDLVGEYVPFYFCPRSVMLYLLHMGNHPELDYKGGQNPILHLEADVERTIEIAGGERWAFSLSNAGAYYTEFRCDLDELDEVEWDHVRSDDFRSAPVKEGKQAEFLVRRFVPWLAIERIGVRTEKMRTRVLAAIAEYDHQPPVVVKSSWYF